MENIQTNTVTATDVAHKYLGFFAPRAGWSAPNSIIQAMEEYAVIYHENKINESNKTDVVEIRHSKEQFDGFTHRFIVKMKVDNDWRNDVNITIYSNSDSYQKLDDFINKHKTDRVVSFNIEHRASKEQDEMAAKFINEVLGSI
jgi:hypothetical protein